MDGKQLKLLSPVLVAKVNLIMCFCWPFGHLSVIVLNLRLPAPIQESLGSKAEAVLKQLEAFNSSTNAHLLSQSPTVANSPSGSRTDPGMAGRRTLCRPDFNEGGAPLDVLRDVSPETARTTDIEAMVLPVSTLTACKSAS